MIEATSRSPADEEGRDGLAAVSVAERRLSADAAAVALARPGRGSGDPGRPGDEAPRLEPTAPWARGPGRRTVFHSPRPQLGDRVRPLRPCDRDRDRAHRGRGRSGCSSLCTRWCAASRATRGARTTDRRERLEPPRPRAARARDGLPRPPVLACVQPRRHVHRRRRRPARLDDALRGGQPEASAGRIDAPLLIELAVPTTAAGTRLDRYLAGEPTVGSRALAERLIDGGGVTVDGERRTKSYRLAWRRAGGVRRAGAGDAPAGAAAGGAPDRLRGRAPARRRQAGGRRRPSGRGQPKRDACLGTPGVRCRRRRSRAARNRPPTRSRYLGAPRGRAQRGGIPQAAAACAPARARA